MEDESTYICRRQSKKSACKSYQLMVSAARHFIKKTGSHDINPIFQKNVKF